MRKISEKELDRTRKKAGVKVKRRLGSVSKKPEPEAEDMKVLSGPATSETSVPALIPVMERMADVFERLESRDGSKKSGGALTVAENEKKVREEREEQKQHIETVVQAVVAKAIEPEVVKPEVSNLPKFDPSRPPPPLPKEKPRIPFKHFVHRDRTGFIRQIVSTNGAGNTWTHDVLREDNLIKEIVSTPV